MSHPANRRRFIQTTAGSSIGTWIAAGVSGQAEAPTNTGSAAILDAGGVAKKIWIDPSIAAWRPGPWRKVHIEYHTSRHMPRLAERFNADEFGDRLLAAHVNGATVFSKDMYGYSYFPSAHGRMQIRRHARKLALDPFFFDDPLNFIDRGCACIPGRLGVILAKIAYQLLELDVGDIGQMSSCMARID